MNSVSPIVSEDAARRRRRCKRINAADRWHRGEYSPLSGFKSDRLSPVADRCRLSPTAQRAMVVVESFGEAIKTTTSPYL
jgi:hypothetical protein